MNQTIPLKAKLQALQTKAFSDSGRADYKRSINRLIYGLWSGQIDRFSFVDSMLLAINRNLTRAWLEGASECGIGPQELTVEERSAMDMNINAEIAFAVNFAADIMMGSKRNGGKLRTLQVRSETWATAYDRMYNLAMQMACADAKLMWMLGVRKEHCGSCTRLNGRVYRASVWAKYGIAPQSRDLECGGWRCGCRFEQTNLPVTPGRPPNIP